MPEGRPHASCLRRVESYLKDMGMAGMASAWAIARRRPREYRRKVDGGDALLRRMSPYPILTWPESPNSALE